MCAFIFICFVFFFKQKTAYEVRISDWSSDVCSSDLFAPLRVIGWPWEGAPDDPAWREAMAAHPQARPARVVEQHRSGYIVADGPGEGFAVESLPEWQRPSGYRKGSSSQDQRAA